MPSENDKASDRGDALLDLTLDVLVARLKEVKEGGEGVLPLSAAELSAMTAFMRQHGITISAYDAKHSKKASAITAALEDLPAHLVGLRLPGDRK